MAGFTKLFNSILDSTIWQEPNGTRILWITMLAMSDSRGEVQASVPGLARRAGIDLEECQAGLECLASPDMHSRTQTDEGRRIRQIDGGWALINHGKYRALLSAEERREYNRKKQAEWRLNRQKNVNDMSMTVNHNKQCQHISEAEADTDTEEKKKRSPKVQKPSKDEVLTYGQTLAPPFLNADGFVDFYESKGWKVGSQKMQDWQAAVRTWHRKDKLPAPGKKGERSEDFKL
jgi:hypothetical protein